MPSCSTCGAQMIQVKMGRGGMGGPGNRYRCPNMPHRKCPKCGHVLDTRHKHWAPTIKAECHYCDYKETF